MPDYKVTAWAPTADEVIRRMDRALREFRIRGVATNLTFLENIIGHPDFLDNSYTTRFIDTTPALFEQVKRKDRATKLLNYVADVTVNGHPETRDRPQPREDALQPVAPWFEGDIQAGTKNRLDDIGPEKFGQWLRDTPHVLVTDTTMRDSHQSLLATRMRTNDIVNIGESYAKGLPELLSLECWGGATFDVSMRFLTEDPWERLEMLRERVPNILLQMLVRGANGVGYTNYPDNVVTHFIKQAATSGIDLFRVFDCFNWIDNMRVSMDAILEEDKLCEAAICYTGDMLDPARSKYNLKYYIDLAKERNEISLPTHFHTHDTSGISAATTLAAIEAGVDAIDGAMDALSGLTSQPCLGSMVAAMRGTPRDCGLSRETIEQISFYWEAVRNQYAAFESDLRGPASEVYLHEMPGGQFTNLKEQARSMGLETRWHEVAKAYSDVNQMFGDIIKVTPSSKVVGDMALMMISQDLSIEEVEDPDVDISFPDSVVAMMRGELSQPPGGFPEGIRSKVLKGDSAMSERASAVMPPADLPAIKTEVAELIGHEISEQELASYNMYPKVFTDFAATQDMYGPTSALPTPVYFYGMNTGDEVFVEIEKGKTLVIRCLAWVLPCRALYQPLT